MAQTRKGSAKRSAPSYIMAIVGVSLVLFLLGILGWIIINANKLGQYFKENIAMNVYIRENVSPRDSAALVKYIVTQPYVKEYEYVTKDLAKQKYLQDGNKDWGALLDRNPLPASIDFRITKEYASIDSLSKIKNDLLQNIAVSDVQYPQSLVTNLNNIINKISVILLSVIVIISILVIFLIDNTIRLAMFSNRFLIKTMQMVGATRWFISRPMDLRAFINGLISGLLAVGGLIAIIIFAENQLPYLKALRDYPLLIMLFIVIILLGICISFFSTHRSVLKYLKMKLDELY
ncbi:MAG: permease-like cell division protein FtsX [Bacteroidota bacterium]|jgi:cell division transport system permease protein|nr:permease-like cell division protein FtsX [Bacteroidota bacterium]